VKKAKAFLDREITLIPNGIDTDRFKPMEQNVALAESLSKSALGGVPTAEEGGLNTLVIGFVGELREKKGLKPLLSAYAQVNKNHPAALLIVGEIRQGEDKQVFDEFQNSNPDHRIIVTGYVSHNDLPAYYSLMDVFVHPSLRDGMPNAILEAMACELPVIATPVGGIMDVLQDGKNGVAVDVNNPDLLAEKILELQHPPEKGKSLGKSARQTIREKFTLAKELEANLDVYRKMGLKV
jgi:glycosyltransferase involved in cell wall biosynthesis